MGPRVRALGDRSYDRPVTSRPGREERERLAATLGALLRQLRAERRMGTRCLAVRAAVARSTVTRLEAGERRPRASLLGGIAYALDPTNPTPIRDALVAAAGPSLVPESEWSTQRRRRRMGLGLLAGTVPLPGDLSQRIALHRAADSAYRRALAIFDRPGALDDNAALREITRLMDASHALRDEAGPPVALQIGGHRITAGWAMP